MKRPSLYRLAVLAGSVALLSAGGTALAQGPGTAATPAPRPAPIPRSGTVVPDPAVEAKMRSQVKVPEGFDLTLFAGPPVAMYPTCVTEAPEGAIFVCVDPNASLSVLKGVGRVMRLVDDNHDGRADRYTTFAEMDSPRGAVFDGETLYVNHPPTLTAYRDTNGDGIADWSQDLVTGLGFDLDFRGADHTTNGIQMGSDGWIYVGVGDYGFRKAIGADGTQITHRGGGVVRVRPDGTNLEIYATGTRNIYDVAISPFLELFSRDNTNDGDGWNTRLHYIPQGANLGYPSLYQNFPTEHFPTLFDYGGGSGVGDLWLQDPAWPEPFRNTLLTADWTVNKVFRHPLTPKGASFEVQQEEFISMVRPSDLTLDDRSNLYLSSLAGGQFSYIGDTVGYVFRVTPAGVATAAPPVRTATDAQLVSLLSSANEVHRFHAQREILRRGAKDATVRALGQMVQGAEQPAFARVAAMLTLKQLAGARANPVLLQVVTAPDPRVRELALRALADRQDQLQGVSSSVFVKALADPDDHVKVQAITGLVRLGASDAAEAILPLVGSGDQGLSHLAVNALVRLDARDALLRAMDTGSPAVQAGALRALAQMHDPATVAALLDRLGRAQGAARTPLLQTLARLYNQEGTWTGDWWTTRPAFLGPYFDPAPWEGSPRIRAALREALLSASGDELRALADNLVLNRVLPQGAAPLVMVLSASRDPQREEVIDAMLGHSNVDASQVPALARLDTKSPELHAAVVQMLAKQTRFSESMLPLLRTAALDASLAADVRGQVVNALVSVPGQPGTEAAVGVLAQLDPAGGGEDTPLDAAWRRFVGNNRRAQEVDYFIGLARTGTQQQRVLAYSVLLQQVRGARAAPALREKVAPVIDAAWSDPTSGPALARAVVIMRLESQYADRMKTVSRN